MFVVTRLPGEDMDLSRSIRDMVLTLAEVWSLELERNPLPPMYSLGIKFRPEDPEQLAEEWVDPYTTKERGYGDCDDLTIWRLAEIFREKNYDPRPKTARRNLPAWPMVMQKMGTGNYHVAIRHKDGREEDPALILLQREHPGKQVFE